MLLTPWPLTVTLALVAVAAIPTRRLFLAGVGSRLLTAYLLALMALGFLAASGLGPDRLVVPCFVVAFVAPLVASPAVPRSRPPACQEVGEERAASGDAT